MTCNCHRTEIAGILTTVLCSQSDANSHTQVIAVSRADKPETVLHYVVQTHRPQDGKYRYRVYAGYKYLQSACSKVQSLGDLLKHKRWIGEPFWKFPTGQLREYQFTLDFADVSIPDSLSFANFKPIRS